MKTKDGVVEGQELPLLDEECFLNLSKLLTDGRDEHERTREILHCRERQLREAQSALRKAQSVGHRCPVCNYEMADIYEGQYCCEYCDIRRWHDELKVVLRKVEGERDLWRDLTQGSQNQVEDLEERAEAAESKLAALRGAGEGEDCTECGHSCYMHHHVADGLGCDHRSKDGSPCGCERVMPRDAPSSEGKAIESALEGDCQERLSQIVDWCNAYPEEIFIPISHESMEKAHTILEASGISLGAIHGAWARHLLKGIHKIALSSPKPSTETRTQDINPKPIEMAKLSWLTIASAPIDGREVWVYTAARDGLPAFQSKCAYHPDAGWCTDEIREVTHWKPLPEPSPERVPEDVLNAAAMTDQGIGYKQALHHANVMAQWVLSQHNQGDRGRK